MSFNTYNWSIIIACIISYCTADYQLILEHKDISLGYFDESILTTGLENENDITANAYSIIGNLNTTRYLDNNGKYQFKLIYYNNNASIAAGNPVNHTLIWKQSSWITLSGEAQGYEEIYMPPLTTSRAINKFYFVGLSLSPSSCSKYVYLNSIDPQHTSCRNSVAYFGTGNFDILGYNEAFATGQQLYIYYDEATTTTSPTTEPSYNPSVNPTYVPTLEPTTTSPPTTSPTTPSPTTSWSPTINPTFVPTFQPSLEPTTTSPTISPTYDPTINPTLVPSLQPTLQPTIPMTGTSTKLPSSTPTISVSDPITSYPTKTQQKEEERESAEIKLPSARVSTTAFKEENSMSNVDVVLISMSCSTVVFAMVLCAGLFYFYRYTKLKRERVVNVIEGNIEKTQKSTSVPKQLSITLTPPGFIKKLSLRKYKSMEEDEDSKICQIEIKSEGIDIKTKPPIEIKMGHIKNLTIQSTISGLYEDAKDKNEEITKGNTLGEEDEDNTNTLEDHVGSV